MFSGSNAHWLSGESGMVGQLFFEATPSQRMAAETSVGFRCDGLLKDASSRNVNIESLGVTPRASTLDTPILCVAATAAEAGKTVLAGKIIRYLVSKGCHVAAVKVTGTGGTMDSQAHREAGAFFTADQVDAGLITTYTNPDRFRTLIIKSFLHAQDQGPDLILAELGGDIIFANNPTFLGMPEIRRNLQGLIVISGDSLSCYGVVRYLEGELEIPTSLIHHFSSPFRNFAGMRERLEAMGIDEVHDPNDPGQIEDVVSALQANSKKGNGGEP
jgi:hypothetical protein